MESIEVVAAVIEFNGKDSWRFNGALQNAITYLTNLSSLEGKLNKKVKIIDLHLLVSFKKNF